MTGPPLPVGPDLLYGVAGGIGRITFNRPRARNALTFAMYEQLAEICTAAEQDRSVRVLVLTGAGEAFAAGTDIAEFRAFRDAEDGIAYEARIDRVLSVIERCRVPTIAAISGPCTGGGLAIAACCDLRIGSASARFGVPIARTLGNVLSVQSLARLAALIGPGRVKDLVFTARLVGAEEAAAIGLVGEVLPTFEALRTRTEELARLVAGHAPLTLQATKEGLRRVLAGSVPEGGDDLVRLGYGSADFREGLEAFLAKRSPRFTGA